MIRRWLVSVLLATYAAPLRAEPGEEAVRLQYTAPDGCPDATSFTAQVRERTARGRFAEASELARTFDVELVADAQGFSGSLEFLDDAGTKVSRHVQGEQCDAVVSSLALIAALALDATLPSEESEPSAPTPTRVDAPPLAKPLPPAPAAHKKESQSGVHPSSLREVRIGVLAGYGSAIRAPRVGLLGQLDFESGFSLRLSAHYSWHELAVDAGRSASLQLSGLETSLCPWRLRRGTLAVAPCLALDLGALRASGVPSGRLTSTQAETIWWAAVGAQLGLSWQPESPFWLELRAAAEFPLRAGYRFTFENPDKTAYEVPNVAGSCAIGVGVRFW